MEAEVITTRDLNKIKKKAYNVQKALLSINISHSNQLNEFAGIDRVSPSLGSSIMLNKVTADLKSNMSNITSKQTEKEWLRYLQGGQTYNKNKNSKKKKESPQKNQ